MSLLKLLCGQADDSDGPAGRAPPRQRRRKHSSSSGDKRYRHSRSVTIDEVELRGRLVQAHGRYTVHPFSATSKYINPKTSAAVGRALSVIGGRPISWKREREDRTTRVGHTLAFFVDISKREGVKVTRYTSLTFSNPDRYPSHQSKSPRASRERTKRSKTAPSRSTATASTQSTSSSRSSSSGTGSTASTSQHSPTVSSGSTKPSDVTFTTSSTEMPPPDALLRAWRKGHVTTLAGHVLTAPIPRRAPGSIRVTNIVTASTEAKAKLKRACPFDISFPSNRSLIETGDRVCFELEKAGKSQQHLQAKNVRKSDTSDQAGRECGVRLVGKVLRRPTVVQNDMQETGLQTGVVVVKDAATIEDHIANRCKVSQEHIDLNPIAQEEYKDRQYGWLFEDSKEPNGLDNAQIGDLLAFKIIQGDYVGDIELAMASRPHVEPAPNPPGVYRARAASVSSSEASGIRTVISETTATATQTTSTATTLTPPPPTRQPSRRNSHMSRRNSMRGRSRRGSHKLS